MGSQAKSDGLRHQNRDRGHQDHGAIPVQRSVMRESSLAGAFLFSLIVLLTLQGHRCSDSSDDPTRCAYFLIKIVHQFRGGVGGVTFDVFAELLGEVKPIQEGLDPL